MKRNYRLVVVLCVVASFLAACGPSQADQDAAASQVAANSFATQTASAPTATDTPQPTDTATPVPSATLVPSATPNVSQTAAAATREAFLATRQVEYTATAAAALATQQAEEAIWSQLVSDGSVTYSKGDLYTVDDFEESWAQRNWYQWWWFGYSLSDFVLTTHIDWQIPQDAVWGLGGCGFVARLKDEYSHLLIFISPKGNVELGAATADGVFYQGVHWQNPDLPNYSTFQAQLTGSVDFWLVVEKEFVTAYVDGVKYYQWYVALTKPGDIGYTIVSGTNRDFGITCTFTNTQVWGLNE